MLYAHTKAQKGRREIITQNCCYTLPKVSHWKKKKKKTETGKSDSYIEEKQATETVRGG